MGTICAHTYKKGRRLLNALHPMLERNGDAGLSIRCTRHGSARALKRESPMPHLGDVRFGSLADVTPSIHNVGFAPESGHRTASLTCPLMPHSGHSTQHIRCASDCDIASQDRQIICRGSRRIIKQPCRAPRDKPSSRMNSRRHHISINGERGAR